MAPKEIALNVFHGFLLKLAHCFSLASELIRDFDQHWSLACQRVAQRSGEGLAGGWPAGIDAIAFCDRAEIAH
jgi:hypothetical protein